MSMLRPARGIFFKRLQESRKSLLFYLLNAAFVIAIYASLPVISSAFATVNTTSIPPSFSPQPLSFVSSFPYAPSIAWVTSSSTGTVPPIRGNVPGQPFVRRYASLFDLPINNSLLAVPVDVALVVQSDGSLFVGTPNFPDSSSSLVSGELAAMTAVASLLPDSAPRLSVAPFAASYSYYYPGSNAVIVTLVPSLSAALAGFAGVLFICAVGTLASRDMAAKAYLYRLCLRPISLYIGNGVFDGTLSLIFNFAVASICVAAGNVFPPLAYLSLLLNALGCVLFAYIISLRFKVAETAARWMYPLNILVYMCSAVMAIFLQPTLWAQYYIIMGPIFLLYPPAGLCSTLVMLSAHQACISPSCQSTTPLIINFIMQVLALPVQGALCWISEVGLARPKPTGREMNPDAPLMTKNLYLSYEYDKYNRGCCRKLVGRKLAVADVSMKLRPKSVFALLGPNGAGKSSLFRILSGDQRPDSGKAEIFGLDCEEDRQRIRSEASFMEQEEVFLDMLTVIQLLRLVCDIRNVDYAVLDRFLDRMLLSDFKNAVISTLSGGQRRKVFLIAALVNEPKLLVLDEPSTGVDIASRRICHEEILRFGGAVFFASHSMDEVGELATDLGILVKGAIREHGMLEDVEMRYGSGYLVRASTEQPDRLLEFLTERLPAGSLTLEMKSKATLHATVLRNSASIPQLFALMKKASHLLTDYSVSDSSLASTFVRFIEEQREEEGNDETAIVREVDMVAEAGPVAEWLGHVPLTGLPRSRCRVAGCRNLSTCICAVCQRYICQACYLKEESHFNKSIQPLVVDEDDNDDLQDVEKFTN